MTERIDERLEVMGVDTAGMTDEQKFTAATGLTRYTEYEANNAWYVPGGAANVPVATEEPAGPTEDYKVEPVEGVKYTQEDVDTYNAELDGAVKEGDPKTSSAEIVTE